MIFFSGGETTDDTMPAELGDEVPLPTETGDYPDGEGQAQGVGHQRSLNIYKHNPTINFPKYVNLNSFLSPY